MKFGTGNKLHDLLFVALAGVLIYFVFGPGRPLLDVEVGF